MNSASPNLVCFKEGSHDGSDFLEIRFLLCYLVLFEGVGTQVLIVWFKRSFMMKSDFWRMRYRCNLVLSQKN
jgi:hypothetical protein